MPKRLPDLGAEFGEFVEEKNAAMSEGDLARRMTEREYIRIYLQLYFAPPVFTEMGDEAPKENNKR